MGAAHFVCLLNYVNAPCCVWNRFGIRISGELCQAGISNSQLDVVDVSLFRILKTVAFAFDRF